MMTMPVINHAVYNYKRLPKSEIIILKRDSF